MKKLILILFIPFAMVSYAQNISPEVVASSGDYFETNNVSLSWTLGEISIETIEDTAVTLTQGFQQPSYSFVSISESKDPGFDIRIYPNPARDYVIIENKKDNGENIRFELYDLNGKLLCSKEANTIVRVNLIKYNKSMYLLKLFNTHGNDFKIYRIIKK